jgi:hypothetical protein
MAERNGIPVKGIFRAKTHARAVFTGFFGRIHDFVVQDKMLLGIFYDRRSQARYCCTGNKKNLKFFDDRLHEN